MEYSTVFKSHNVRATPLREKIYDVIATKKSAISKKEIEEKLNDLDRITLYRTLKIFEQKGIIHQVVDGTNTLKYASCENQCTEHNHKHDHIHFYCNACNETYCLENVSFPTPPQPKGYIVNDVNVLYSGTCKYCSA